MLVLFENPCGYAIFELLNEKKLKKVDKLFESFEDPETANNLLKLKHFRKFSGTTEALEAVAATIEGKMSKPLKKLMKKLVSEETQSTLAVAEAKLGSLIKEKFDIPCVANSSIQELMRCIRSQAECLIPGLTEKSMSVMSLGLAHGLSGYKLKYSPDKVDTMIVQAVGILDDLDKELNNFIMRLKEWNGWQFPEMAKIVTDNMALVRTVKKIGMRVNAVNCDLSDILPPEVEKELKEQAEISTGTEITDEDLVQIRDLCDQIINLSDLRANMWDYLKNRMTAIAPNLTLLVGELVGARLIAHAGSLLNLAKHPASTVQILGAEKALFRALKTKHDTPKYGLIYHAQLVGQASVKNKGKMSRMLAAKVSLAVRVDALAEEDNLEVGINAKAKLESRAKAFEEGYARKLATSGKSGSKFDKYSNKSITMTNTSTASTLPVKRKIEEVTPGEETLDTSVSEPKKKKIKKEKDIKKEE